MIELERANKIDTKTFENGYVLKPYSKSPYKAHLKSVKILNCHTKIMEKLRFEDRE